MLAHRLDADTSGCLLIALRRAALHEAQACFAEGRASKTYWAVVLDAPPAPSGTITAALSKQSNRTGGWRMAVDSAGSEAVTDYAVLGSSDGLCWLELRLRTGRTHQARVHCASLGCPILGDPIYGTEPAPDDRLHLLARGIHLPLDPPVTAVASPPPHMLEALTACGYDAASQRTG